MRKISLLISTLISAFSLSAQTPVVNWSFSAKKTSDKMYEIELVATVTRPWHIYSQTTPDGGPLPTKISFNKHPLVTIEGKVKESGKLVKKFEEVFDIDVKYFDGNVKFVQLVKLKVTPKPV